jgi:branched-chain amino acid transport system substrate-binding protein
MAILGAAFIVVPLLNACGARGSTPKEIVIGASIPKSGILAAFGSYEEWGYTTAVNDINAGGGLPFGTSGTKIPVRLILYDDESQPDKVTQNIERLILKDGVHATLGSATPPLVLSGAAVAEREKMPMVTPIAPIRAFLGARPEGWKYVWDIFFDELDMTQQQFKTMDTVQSNKRVALFTDNEQDGEVMGGLWEETAPKFGYQVVYHAKFPVGTTDYGDLIRRAQEATADIVIAQMVTPDVIALWRQMQALNYRPAAVFFEKGGEPVEFVQATGKAGEGVMVAGYWHPTLSYPGAQALRQRFESETKRLWSQHISDTYVAAQVLLDAISAAGSIDREAINNAIAKTDKTYVVGPVNFAKGPGGHTAVLPSFMTQWQNGEPEIVYPPELATKKLIYPLPAWSEIK